MVSNMLNGDITKMTCPDKNQQKVQKGAPSCQKKTVHTIEDSCKCP
jgi:hypothetical protein